MAAPAGDGRARLVVSARVVFTGPVFGMRGLIESSSLEACPLCATAWNSAGLRCVVCAVFQRCSLMCKGSVQSNPSSFKNRVRQGLSEYLKTHNQGCVVCETL